MKQNNVQVISLPSMLLVLFIGLKLTGFIAWSWFWILSPVLIPLSLILFIALILFIGAVLNA